MKKFSLLIKKAVFGLLSITALSIPAFGQNLSYNQTINLITTFESQKTYSPSTTGPMLNQIIQGLAANYANDGLYAGLEKRLVGSLSTTKMKLQAAGAENNADAQFLAMLYYASQSVVPAQITDDNLKSRVGKDGKGLIKAEETFWKNSNLTNGYGAFEQYSPAMAGILASVVAMTWYQGAAKVYENTSPTWASESLWQIYSKIRLVELAKHSTVLKLLAQEGYLDLPTFTRAHFEWSGMPDIWINLTFVHWTSNDLAELVRLLDNPYYKPMAQRQLVQMIPGCRFVN